MVKNLEMTLGNLVFKNPLILGSGTITERKEFPIKSLDSGAAAVISRTLRIKNEHRPLFRPSVYYNDHYMLNSDNQNITPVNYWVEEIPEIKKHGLVGISISARNPADSSDIAEIFKTNVEPDFYEINFSCSHSALLYGKISYKSARSSLSNARNKTNKPIFLKLSLDNIVLDELKGIEKEELADAFVMSNSIGPGLAINIKTGRPYLQSVYGGVTGPAIKSFVLRSIYDIKQKLDTPIVGVGGISSSDDVLEYLMAGSSLVEIYSAAHIKGPSIFGEIKNALEAYSKNNNVDLKSVIGCALEGGIYGEERCSS